MILVQLFWSFFQVGLFSIGGGYAAMPLIQKQVVDLHSWLTLTEFTDLITISQMTPGPIAINSATFVGIRIAGIPGALIATLGAILPGCAIVAFLTWIYFRYKNLTVVQDVLGGLRPAVVALIASSGLSILVLSIWGEGGFQATLESINWIAVGLFAAAFFVLRKWKPNPIFVMIGAGIVGGILYLVD